MTVPQYSLKPGRRKIVRGIQKNEIEMFAPAGSPSKDISPIDPHIWRSDGLFHASEDPLEVTSESRNHANIPFHKGAPDGASAQGFKTIPTTPREQIEDHPPLYCIPESREDPFAQKVGRRTNRTNSAPQLNSTCLATRYTHRLDLRSLASRGISKSKLNVSPPIPSNSLKLIPVGTRECEFQVHSLFQSGL